MFFQIIALCGFLITGSSMLLAGLFDPPKKVHFVEKNPILSHWRDSVSTPSYWINPPAAPFVIDDFEDLNFYERPTWWTFEDLSLNVLENDKEFIRLYELGDISLHVQGKTSKWLFGGIGTYLAIDGSRFDALEIVYKGNPLHPSRIEIELYDDDNQNWAIENVRFLTQPDDDDVFAYLLPIQSSEWTRLHIPFSDFKDRNPKVGDDIWNPSQIDQSGGLIQLQILFYSEQKKGKIDLQIDSISFIKNSPPILPNDFEDDSITENVQPTDNVEMD